MIPNSLFITLLLVTGPYSVTTGEAKIIIEKSKAHFAEAGINLKVKKIYKIRDRYAYLETIPESERKFYLYRSFVRRVGYGGNGRTHALLPPMLQPPGIRFIGGFGEGGTCHGRFSVSNGTPIRSNGMEGFTMSSIALSHEVAHTIGAEHKDGVANIMHPAALQFTGQKIGFLQSTVYRMKRCLIKK